MRAEWTWRQCVRVCRSVWGNRCVVCWTRCGSRRRSPDSKRTRVAPAGPRLTPGCQKMLSIRAQLWELLDDFDDNAKALPKQAPESMGQLLGAIVQSPQRSYLLLWIGGLILGLFVCGCCCGHVSRRLRILLMKKRAWCILLCNLLPQNLTRTLVKSMVYHSSFDSTIVRYLSLES